MKNVLIFFAFSMIFLSSCSKQEFLPEQIVQPKTSQITYLSEQEDIIDAVEQSINIQNSIKEHLKDKHEEEYAELVNFLQNFNEEDINDKGFEKILSLFGFTNIIEFEHYLESLNKIVQKYPILIENEMISKELFKTLSINSENSTTAIVRTGSCSSACDQQYWSIDLGCTLVSTTCQLCGIACSVMNLGRWTECISHCNDNEE